jgi:hypothetical protein
LLKTAIAIGMRKTKKLRKKSETIIVYLLSHLSTYAPATGPIKNTGIIINIMSFAKAIAE